MSVFVKCYAPEWDEVFQVEADDTDALRQAAPADGISATPFDGLPLRPRSSVEANAIRAKELAA